MAPGDLCALDGTLVTVADCADYQNGKKNVSRVGTFGYIAGTPGVRVVISISFVSLCDIMFCVVISTAL
jgi:hypothetical protein